MSFEAKQFWQRIPLKSKVYRQLDLFCHSMAMALPTITPTHLSLPLLVRMVTRGACDRLEMFKKSVFNFHHLLHGRPAHKVTSPPLNCLPFPLSMSTLSK